MKKLELEDNIYTALQKREIIQKIMDIFNQNRIKLKQLNDKAIIGMYGSRFKAHTRSILADPSVLPVKITIKFHNNGNGTELNIYMKEGYIGLPSIFLYKKYGPIFARLMNNIKIQFLENNYQKKEKIVCNNCGVQIVDKNQKFCEICGWELIKI